MRLLIRAAMAALALVLLGAPDAPAKEPKPAWIIGMSWGLSCGKEAGVPKGRKCNESQACLACCHRKADSCETQFPNKQRKCDDAWLACNVTVSNPDLNTLPGGDAPYSLDLGTSAPTQRAPAAPKKPSTKRVPETTLQYRMSR